MNMKARISVEGELLEEIEVENGLRQDRIYIYIYIYIYICVCLYIYIKIYIHAFI